MPPSNKALRVIALGGVLAGVFSVLAGCSEYLDRRETISLSGGDAVASDQVTHMVDPWPRDSANRDIAFNGEKMEAAVNRYRTDRVYPPSGVGTSSSYQQGAAPANTTPVGPTVTAPAAPVK